MSNAIFPVLPGLTWDRKRTANWSNIEQEAVSGLTSMVALWSYPRWDWELAYEFLRSSPGQAELQTLVGFFNSRRGNFDSFLFDDEDDNTVTGQHLGVGNGATVAFQAVRTLGGFVEPIFNLKATPTVYVNDVAQTGVTYSASGIITLTSAPGAASAVTADLSYYWRVRFLEKASEFNQFMYRLYECKSLKLKGVKGS